MNFIKNINNNWRNELAVFRLKLFFCVALLFVILFSSALATRTVRAYEIGENQIFLIDSSYDNNNRSEIETTLKNVSANAYFYVEDNYYNNLSGNSKLKFDLDLNALALSFDDVIYPKTREIFGYEWNPGIDNDSKITILFTKTKENVGGYFNPNDEYKKENISGGKSNEREMVYLNATFMDDQRIQSFLAHEFQHMITWHYKTKLNGINDDVWLNEGRSEYVSTAIGYDDNYPNSNLKARVDNFLKDQTDSLIEWKNEINDYSSVNLFSQYLADRFGKTIFKLMINNNKAGIESVNNALVDLNRSNINFSDVFTDWTIANYLNDKTLSAGRRYGYFNPNLSYTNLHFSPTSSYIVDDYTKINLAVSIKDWSSKYYEFKAEGNSYEKNIIEISFDGDDSGNFSVPYIVFYNNGTKKVNYLDLNKNQSARLSMADFGINIYSVLLIPSSQKRTSNNGNNVDSYAFSIFSETVENKTQPNGSILKSIESPKIYSIRDNKKRWIIDVNAFVSNGYKWENVVLVLQSELEAFKDGENIYAVNLNLKQSGSLIRGSGYKVYLVENGSKKWIRNEKVFVNLGYNWNNVISISNTELGLYFDGEDIK
jgi:hypothetical protein